jgi:hypothetical protein
LCFFQEAPKKAAAPPPAPAAKAEAVEVVAKSADGKEKSVTLQKDLYMDDDGLDDLDDLSDDDE